MSWIWPFVQYKRLLHPKLFTVCEWSPGKRSVCICFAACCLWWYSNSGRQCDIHCNSDRWKFIRMCMQFLENNFSLVTYIASTLCRISCWRTSDICRKENRFDKCLVCNFSSQGIHRRYAMQKNASIGPVLGVVIAGTVVSLIINLGITLALGLALVCFMSKKFVTLHSNNMKPW